MKMRAYRSKRLSDGWPSKTTVRSKAATMTAFFLNFDNYNPTRVEFSNFDLIVVAKLKSSLRCIIRRLEDFELGQ